MSVRNAFVFMGLVCLAAPMASARAGAAAVPVTEPAAVEAEPLAGIRTHGPRVLLPDGFRPRQVPPGSLDAGPAALEFASLQGAVHKISGASMAGSVSAYRLSPDGVRAVFLADKDTAGRVELYSVPVDGSASPVKISASVVFGSGDQGVAGFAISPDSGHVVFAADANAGGGSNDLYSVPIDGSSPAVQLSPAGARPVTAFGIAPDSTRAVFFGDDTAFGTSAVELYRAQIGVASSAVQLSDVGQGNSAGAVVTAELTPDSARVLYAADATVNNRFQWHSVPLGAGGPGLDVQLSAALGSVTLGAVSPDGSRLVYGGDDLVSGRTDVFSVPVTGGAALRLNPSMAGGGAIALRISADSTRVAYLADQHTAGVHEVYAAQLLVGSSGARLNAPLSGNQLADVLNISPDSGTVVYEADQDTPGTSELFRAPINASAGPTKLHGLVSPDDVGVFGSLGIPIIGRRVVYPVLGSATNLFSVPFDGSATFTQINAPVPSGDTLRNAFLPSTGRRLMAYGIGASVTEEVLVAAIRADLAEEAMNLGAAAGSLGVLDYQITADEAYGVYLQDQDTSGKPELFSRELDSDGDAVVNALDNCPFLTNPAQDTLLFETVLPVSSTTFSWATPGDVRFVRGPLSGVDRLVVDAAGSLEGATSFTDTEIPGALGTGWYYVFALDCAGGSYQTSPGAEPERDVLLP